MLLGSIPWPYKVVSLPIILQLAEEEQYCIFQKKDFPSESSDDINPLLQKLNLAAVVFVQKQRLDITAHFPRSCLSTASCRLLAGRLPDFFHCCLQQKGHWAHITMSMFQVLDAAETQRYKYFNFNQRAPGFKHFQHEQSDSRDHSLQFSSSSVELLA